MASREYAAIECVLFKDERFLRMDGDTRQTFLWLLGHQSRIRCPGLVEGSCITVAQFLRYPLRVSDVDQFRTAIKASTAAITHIVDIGWVEHDLTANLFYLPSAVQHNLPDNKNMLWGWIKNLKEFPSSPLIRKWVAGANEAITMAYGRGDSRQQLISYFARVLGGFSTLKVDKYCVVQEEKDEAGNVVKKKELPGYYNGYPAGVTDGLLHCIQRAEREVRTDGISGSQKPGRKKKLNISKTTDIPENFDDRQKRLWELFLSEQFWVPGHGMQTVFDNVRDPEGLCRKLGGEGFRGVDLDIIYRLSAWSVDNKGRAKKNLGAHLRNCFSRDQKRAEENKQIDVDLQMKRANVPMFDASDIKDEEPTEAQKEARLKALREAGLEVEVVGDA